MSRPSGNGTNVDDTLGNRVKAALAPNEMEDTLRRRVMAAIAMETELRFSAYRDVAIGALISLPFWALFAYLLYLVL